MTSRPEMVFNTKESSIATVEMVPSDLLLTFTWCSFFFAVEKFIHV